MRRKEEISWKLLFADGKTQEEPFNGGSIKNSWDNAIAMELINSDGIKVLGFKIDPGSKPIFYRVKSLDYKLQASVGRQIGNAPPPIIMVGAGIMVNGQVVDKAQGTTQAVIFGYVREDYPENKTAGKLYAWINNKCVNCPDKYIDLPAIENQLNK